MESQPSESDTIRDFLLAALTNERSVLVEQKALIDMLEQINDGFVQVFKSSVDENALSCMLLMNSFASYLAALRVAFSGQSPPTFMVLRGCLESAVYAFLATDAANAEIWLDRENNRERCGEVFRVGNAVQLLRPVDPNLSRYLRESYQGMIDYGAHPNLLSVLNHLTISEHTQGRHAANLAILHPSSSDAVRQTLMACVEIGVVILWLIRHILPNHEGALVAFDTGSLVNTSKETYLRDNGVVVPRVRNRRNSRKSR